MENTLQRRKSVKVKDNSVGHIIWLVIEYLALGLGALVAIFPLYILVVASVKTNAQLVDTSPLLFPIEWHFENYVTAWFYNANSSSNNESMGMAFLYTILITGASIILTVLFGSFVSYILSRFEFKGKKLVKVLFLVASLIPSITVQISIFQIINKINLYDTPFAIILLYSGTDIISIYIFLQFLDNIPKELDEAALVDGCNYFQIYWKIIIPVLKPAIATVCIIKGVAFYNEYYIPSLYWNKHYVISTYLNNMVGAFSTSWGAVSAAAVIAILPTVVLFLLLQNQIYSGLTNGAVKS
jgi:raffinose/stachyose/melibiose transport system permease protein